MPLKQGAIVETRKKPVRRGVIVEATGRKKWNVKFKIGDSEEFHYEDLTSSQLKNVVPQEDQPGITNAGGKCATYILISMLF